jgi:ankyrin repeat protein
MLWLIVISNFLFIVSMHAMELNEPYRQSNQTDDDLPLAPKAKNKKIFKRKDVSKTFPRNNRARTIDVSLPSVSRSPISSELNIRLRRKDNDLINAISIQKIDLVRDYLPLYDPNEKNSLGNTALHYAVIVHNLPITITLLQDPRVNSLIQNRHNKTAYQLFSETDIIDYPILYKKLTIRSQLDQIINAFLLTKEFFKRTPLSKNYKEMIIPRTRTVEKETCKKIFPNYATNEFIHKMLVFRHKSETESINAFLQEKNNNINQQDYYGNKSVHHAVYLNNKKLIQYLISNPAINILITNNNGAFPHQIAFSKKIRTLLFIRQTLDSSIMEEAQYFFLDFPIEYNKVIKDNGVISSSCCLNIRKKLKKKFTEMINSQKNDRKLPSQIKFPQYATTTFIAHRILPYLKQELEQEIEKKEVNHKLLKL